MVLIGWYVRIARHLIRFALQLLENMLWTFQTALSLSKTYKLTKKLAHIRVELKRAPILAAAEKPPQALLCYLFTQRFAQDQACPILQSGISMQGEYHVLIKC